MREHEVVGGGWAFGCERQAGEMVCFSVYTLGEVYTRRAVTELRSNEHYLVSIVVQR